MSRGTRLSAVVSLLGLAECGAEGYGTEDFSEVDTVSNEIIGGTLVSGAACADGSGNECIDPAVAPGVAALIGYGTPAIQDEEFCTGYLIAPGWVATAAHCFYDDWIGEACMVNSNSGAGPNCEVDLGRVDWMEAYDQDLGAVEGQTFFPIKHVYPHTGYNAQYKLHDIALVELEMPVPLETAPRVGMLRTKWVNRLAVGASTVFRSAGWGAYRTRGDVDSPTQSYDTLLRIADDNTYFGDAARCIADTSYTTAHNLGSSLFCSGSRTAGDHDPASAQTDNGIALAEVAQGTCQGDSGGPVYYNVPNAGLTVIGSTSWGIGCALQGYPDVNTRVGDYVDALLLRGGNPFSLPERIRGVRTPAFWAKFVLANFGNDSRFEGATRNNTPIGGDFNGDGYGDVAYFGICGSNNRDCFRVHENNKSGAFVADDYGPPAAFWSTGFRGRPVAGDFNGDGRDDIAYLGRCGSSNCWAVHLSDGSSSFTLANYGWNVWIGGSDTVQRVPLAGDFDNDGFDDVAYWGYCGSDSHRCWRVHLNDGAGKFVATDGGGGAAFKNTQYRSTPMAADFNGDGADDIAYLGTCSGSDCWLVQLNDGDGDFLAPVRFGGDIRFPGGDDVTHTPIAADLNGDGFADFAYRGICGRDNQRCIRTQLNNQKGGLRTAGNGGTPTFYSTDVKSTPFAGDFDADGAVGFGLLGTCSGSTCWQIHQLP